jgi:type II secretory pathway pseudopilin PulG
MGLLGILVALALLVWLAYRGWSVLLLAPATATTAMTYIAIVERLNGKSADWMERSTTISTGANAWKLLRRRSKPRQLPAALLFISTGIVASASAMADETRKPDPLVIQEQGIFAVGGTVISNPGTFDHYNPSPASILTCATRSAPL